MNLEKLDEYLDMTDFHTVGEVEGAVHVFSRTLDSLRCIKVNPSLGKLLSVKHGPVFYQNDQRYCVISLNGSKVFWDRYFRRNDLRIINNEVWQLGE